MPRGIRVHQRLNCMNPAWFLPLEMFRTTTKSYDIFIQLLPQIPPPCPLRALFVVCSFFAVCYLLLAACFFAACCLLLLAAACCVLLVACCLLSVACCLLLAACCLLLAACCLLACFPKLEAKPLHTFANLQN